MDGHLTILEALHTPLYFFKKFLIADRRAKVRIQARIDLKRVKQVAQQLEDWTMAIETTPWDSAEHLKTDEDMQLYLEACIEEAEHEPALILQALTVIARAK